MCRVLLAPAWAEPAPRRWRSAETRPDLCSDAWEGWWLGWGLLGWEGGHPYAQPGVANSAPPIATAAMTVPGLRALAFPTSGITHPQVVGTEPNSRPFGRARWLGYTRRPDGRSKSRVGWLPARVGRLSPLRV